MKKSLKIVLFWLFSLFIFYTLSGFVILPWWTKTYLPSLIKESFQLPLSLEKVTFNPFTFELHVKNIALQDHNESNVSTIEHLYVNYEPSFLFKKEFYVKTILLDRPFANFHIDQNGTFNLLTLFPSSSNEQNATQTSSSLVMPLIIEHVELQKGGIHFKDERVKEPFALDIQPINYVINNLSFYKEGLSIHALKIALQNEEKISLASSISLEPLKFHGELHVDRLPLKDFWRYLLPTLPATLEQGALSLRLPFSMDLSKEVPLLTIDKAEAHLEEIRFLDQTNKVIELPSLKLDGIDFDLQKASIHIQNALIHEAFVDVQLHEHYMPNVARLFSPPATKAATSQQKGTQEKAWTFVLDTLRLTNSALILTDHNVKGVPIHLSGLNATLTSLSSDMNRSIVYELNTSVDKDASLTLKGSFVPSTTKLALELKAKALSLAKVQPYLHPFTTLVLKEGLLFSNATINASFGKNPLIKINADAELSKLVLLDRFKNTLFQWEKLRMDSIAYASSPSSLHVKKISLLKPYVNLDIKKDQTTNFSDIFKTQAAQKSPPKTKPSSVAKETPLELLIGDIALQNGSAHFKDASLPIPFATYITSLNGKFSTLNTQSAKPSVLKLEGKVNKYGYAKIDGSLLPFDFKNQATLKLIFKNLDMKSFTPYSGKFVGYAIKGGKLSMDLSYKIRKGLMEGDNKINLDSLTLGEKIESDEAINVPLGLAIAILKDSHGQIDINLPVSGDMNSPEFRYGSIMWRAIGNLLGSVITSPFKLLGSVLGIETENLTSIDFAAGEFALIGSEEEKMEHYQLILEKRDELKLLITPSFNETIDTQALQENNVTAQIETLIPKGSSEKNSYERAIEKLFVTYYSKEAYKKELQRYQEEKLDKGAIYERLRSKIAEKITVTPEALTTLANKRATAIRDNLITKHKIAPDRLRIQEPQSSDALREKWVGCAISISN